MTHFYLSSIDPNMPLITAFAAIPNSVTTLDLSLNNLDKKTGAELAQAFRAIPNSVTTLDLSGNNLRNKTGAELAQAFEAIPDSVTTLDLSLNNLGNKTGEELTQAFSAIPASVTTIAFSGNDVQNKNMTHLLLSLPSSITTITIDGQSYHPTDYLIQKILPLDKQQAYFNNPFEPIENDFQMDEPTLINLINLFQTNPTSQGYLLSALLLDGSIENLVDEAEINDPQGYEITRALLAIDFYRKAACDEALKPSIEYLLWHKRALRENDDTDLIRNKLNEYQLSPKQRLSNFEEFVNNTPLTENNTLLDIADHSNMPFQDINERLAIYKTVPTINTNSTTETSYQATNTDLITEPSYPTIDPSLILGLLSSMTIGALAITLLWLNTPLWLAISGTIIVSAVSFAACHFFYSTSNPSGNIDPPHLDESMNVGLT